MFPALLLLSLIDFTRDIEPILSRNCYACHGPAMQTSGLRLDRAADALKGGYSGPVIVSGKASQSRLIGVVAEGKMPPGPKKLSAAEVDQLRAWIDEGPKWGAASAQEKTERSTHWAFQPVVKPALPPVKDAGWVRTPIDRFVLARLEREGIPPSQEASRRALLRRLSLDLTGLPPTPAEMQAFLADMRPDAYERAVERLLDSPHYAEKWARHWLDLARYADSDGYESDLERPWAWRYRNWVIDALRRDLPFDQFTIEQLAGDLLPGATPDQRAATGFYRNSLTNREGGVDTEQFRVEQVLDRTNTVGMVWLGLSVGCAQCHDHKYDPTTQRDYYQLSAFFNTLVDHDVEAPLDGDQPRDAAWEQRRLQLFNQFCGPELMKEWRSILLKAADEPGFNEKHQFAWKYVGNLGNGLQPALRLEEHERPYEQRQQLLDYFVNRAGDVFDKERLGHLGWDQLKKQWAELKKQAPKRTLAQTVRENWFAPKTHILLRGDFRSPGIEVARNTPGFLPPLEEAPTRLGLARWLVSKQNPLTARVLVNRVWQEYFGRGLVRTSEDFGVMGEKPSHPELLDWMAAEVQERGWSLKQLHRLIVQSAVYRQSSAAREELRDRDPDNILLARQSRLRLSAEQLRDSALAASGLLNPAIGGASVRPPQPKGVAELGYAGGVKWPESKGADRYRRGLYIHFQRTTPYPQLMNFDAPDSILACSRRQRSNTPLQALNLLNDPVFLEAAQALARRLDGAGFRERVEQGYQWTVGRTPGDKEVATLARHFERAVDTLRSSAKETEYLAGKPDPEAAAWVVMSRVLLNLDEFLHIE